MRKESINASAELPYPLTLDIHSIGLTDQQFYKLCRDNRDLRIELTSQGELLIMAPTGSKTGWRNAKLTSRVTVWSEKDGTGLVFDSSTGFTLPNGAKRSPDVAWINNGKWNALSQEEQEWFAPICPDFVIELRSAEDRLIILQDKMREYIENGAKLGWLIDPITKMVYIYRRDQPVEQLQNPETISGEAVLSEFTLSLRDIW
ncbi:MAG: Uma2 family endonuclease [Acidobacteriota bacterium]